jgi:Alginate lyase
MSLPVAQPARHYGSTTRRIAHPRSRGSGIDALITTDGSLPRELARTRSLHYSDFALQAFAELATLASRTDVDLWGYQSPTTGASIRGAVDFLVPYWTGQTWPYEEITDIDAFQENAQTLKRAAEDYPDGAYSSVLSQLSAGQADLDILRLTLGYWPV